MNPVRGRSRLLAVLITLACVVLAAVGIKVSEPAEFQVVRGTVGQPVTVRGGQVTVDDVRYGTTLIRNGEVTASTTGLFVAVHLTAAGLGRAPLALNRAQLTSGDRTYLSYSSLSGVSADPGFQSQVDAIFEVDPQRIDGLTLEIWASEIVSGYYQRVRVPLGVTARGAAEVRASGQLPIVDPEIYGSSVAIP